MNPASVEAARGRPMRARARAMLAAIGTPIVGDFKYGGAAAKGMGELEDRLHLHARSIDIAHPDGRRLRATAPLPPHMLQALEEDLLFLRISANLRGSMTLFF